MKFNQNIYYICINKSLYNIILLICFQMQACQVCSLYQCISPIVHLVYRPIQERYRPIQECIRKNSLMFQHLKLRHIIENRQQPLISKSFAFHNLHQLIKAPVRSSIFLENTTTAILEVLIGFNNSNPISQVGSLQLPLEFST